MNSRIANPSWRWIIFSLTVAVFLLVAYTGGKSAYADQLESSPSPADWLRAAQIEPDNGAYWYKLGLYRELDIDNGDLNKAIEYFKQASVLDPRSATYLMSLGGAYETAGDLAKAKQSYLAALEDYPLSTEAHWRYGSFLLRQGDAASAFAEIHIAVQGDRALIPLVVSRVWLETHDAGPLLTTILPPDLETYQQALEWFCNAKESTPALATWKRMIALHQTIPIQFVFPLEDVLVYSNHGDDVRQVWREALTASGHGNELQKEGELIFNGGFEFDPVNGGLDWHITPAPGVKFDYDTAAPHSGRRSLRLIFDRSQNIDLQGPWQDVPVESSRSYRFAGYVRTSGISTESGIRFMISFPGSTQPPQILNNLTGDNDWTEQAAEFTPATGVHFVRVLVYRTPSQRFDNKLAGSAWVDDVSIVPSEAAHRP